MLKILEFFVARLLDGQFGLVWKAKAWRIWRVIGILEQILAIFWYFRQSGNLYILKVGVQKFFDREIHKCWKFERPTAYPCQQNTYIIDCKAWKFSLCQQCDAQLVYTFKIRPRLTIFVEHLGDLCMIKKNYMQNFQIFLNIFGSLCKQKSFTVEPLSYVIKGTKISLVIKRLI
jgi:hypothetical protein